MDKIQAIKEAKKLLHEIGGDPQTALAVVQIAMYAGTDPQKVQALLKIAKFLKE